MLDVARDWLRPNQTLEKYNMIPNSFTLETAHVANWLLYSGHIDLNAAYDQARKEAIADGCNDGDSDYFQACIINRLASILDQALGLVISEVAPEAAFDALEWLSLHGRREDHYREMSATDFILTLLIPGLMNIDRDAVAEIVFEHIEKVAA